MIKMLVLQMAFLSSLVLADSPSRDADFIRYETVKFSAAQQLEVEEAFHFFISNSNSRHLFVRFVDPNNNPDGYVPNLTIAFADIEGPSSATPSGPGRWENESIQLSSKYRWEGKHLRHELIRRIGNVLGVGDSYDLKQLARKTRAMFGEPKPLPPPHPRPADFVVPGEF